MRGRREGKKKAEEKGNGGKNEKVKRGEARREKEM